MATFKGELLLECPLPKLIIASLIFEGLPSLFDSFAFRKYEEISNNLKDINLKRANKAFTKSGGKYYIYYKLSGYISEKCFKLYPKLKPQNQKAKKARESKSNSNYKDKFVLDSEATKHYSPNRDWLINYKPISNKSIRIANRENMPILDIGDILI
ncbi:hypothetical protein BUE80_DR013941 [Diplocarpon rosae]|nr:hypothetical protein BUE80_DR013941 [Diplocarpon rosae]